MYAPKDGRIGKSPTLSNNFNAFETQKKRDKIGGIEWGTFCINLPLNFSKWNCVTSLEDKLKNFRAMADQLLVHWLCDI